MALSLMYITNKPKIISIANKYGIDRVWIDLEILGKEERQKNMNTVKSYHTIEDIKVAKKLLTDSELLVRINPWNEKSRQEIDAVIEAGAERIMLPMWKSFDEIDKFLKTVNGRVKTVLLLETKEAVECVDEVLNHPMLDEIHIGLNDLHLSYNLTFMFELLANGMVEKLCNKFKQKGITYGFGGIANLGEGLIPAEKIIMEHYRLGSTRAILSRSFCELNESSDISEIDAFFDAGIKEIRDYEETLKNKTEQEFIDNKLEIQRLTKEVVKKIKEKRQCK